MKLKKILKNKILIKDKYLYLNSLLAIEPLKLRIKNNISIENKLVIYII